MRRHSEPRTVVVTGASAGIGAALARALGRQGRNLVLTARRALRLEALAAELGGCGVEVLTIPIDLEDASAPGTIVRRTLDRFGRLDVLVNNAGFGLPTVFSEAALPLSGITAGRSLASVIASPPCSVRRGALRTGESTGMSQRRR